MASDSEIDWKQRLDHARYHVLRESGTERPWSSPLEAEERPGLYHCAGCGRILFRAEDKYHSGSGWPSFTAPTDPDAVETRSDSSLGMSRVEVVCAGCNSHLGHVFDDGPRPTGLRFCINGLALDFEPEEGEPEDGAGP